MTVFDIGFKESNPLSQFTHVTTTYLHSTVFLFILMLFLTIIIRFSSPAVIYYDVYLGQFYRILKVEE
uniref:Uncharacterized protein n=1 Tax=Heterorhabditis bacteriophora TaxID=37862 RepID=A0A1I7W6E0_HETBA